MQPESRRPRPTMVDVARAAGVSQSTVSFVLNDRRDVVISEATRARVLSVAREVGYRVNRRAQEMRLQHSTTIGIVSHEVASRPYAGQMLTGLQHAAREGGFICMIVDLDTESDPGGDAISGLIDRDIAGLVHAAAATHEVVVPEGIDDVRTVFAGCWPAGGNSVGEGVILPDDVGGGRVAARHLLELGHRDIVFLGGVEDVPATRDRERGFDEALRESQLLPDTFIRLFGNYDIDSGYRLTQTLFATRRPTALVCGNDQMALGAILALHEIGLRVPDDVSIVGYDDQEKFAGSMHPRLTTVRLPHYEIGRRAADVIMGEPAAKPLTETVSCDLILRDSTSFPRRP